MVSKVAHATEFFLLKDDERWAAYNCTTSLTPLAERQVSLGTLELSSSVVFQIHQPAQLKDFGWSGTAMVISQRAKDAFDVSNVTGWTTYDVAVQTKDGETIPGYYGLAITGRCGPIRWERSKVVSVEMPGGMIPHFEGVVFDVSTWDGADIFVATGPGWFVLATAKVSEVVRRLRLSNIRLLPASSYRIPTGLVHHEYTT
jgi:hypothetical protein